MPITIKNSAGGGVTLDSTTSSNETLQLPSGGGTLAPLASPVFTGNVGIGVVPETDWYTGYHVIQLAEGGVVGGYVDNSTYLGSNWKDDGNNKYINTDEASVYKQSAGRHIFQVAPSGSADSAISWTTAMTIDNGGNLFLGSGTSSTPWADTSGAGTFRFQKDNGTNNASMQFSSDGEKTGYSMIYLNLINGSNDENIQSFYRNNNNVGSIKLNGTTGVSYETTSDYRVKENVVPMTDSTNRLKALKPSRFNFISEPLVTIDGFLAHEAGEVVPECISGTKDAMKDEEYEVTPAVVDDEGNETTAAVMGTRSVPDMQGIDQAKLVPLLTATIQELIARIEALENV